VIDYLAGRLSSRPSQESRHESVFVVVSHREWPLRQTPCSRAPQLRAAANDKADADVGDARRWRNLAARARRAAGWVSVRDEALLTRLAEEYEGRAKRAEDQQSVGA